MAGSSISATSFTRSILPTRPGAIEAWLQAGLADPEVGWTPDELAQHVREEHSTFAWLLEAMLEHAGFEIADVSFTESAVFPAYLRVKR